jgi:cysteine desulfurase / selenocysteine lyase
MARIYLNSAASGWPKAPGVVEAVSAALAAPPYHPGRVAGQGRDSVRRCRELCAQLLDVPDPSRIVLTVNATHALNLALLGLATRKLRILTSVIEHNSVHRPLNHLAARGVAEIEHIGLAEGGALDRHGFRRALERGPDLVVLSHVSNVTGMVNEIAALFGEAKEAGALTILDAAQSLGCIEVHPLELRADLAAFTGHKGLHGPPGCGGLYVSPEIELSQVIVGGTGVRSDLALHPAEMPARLEAGTPNVPALDGMACALEWTLKRSPAQEQSVALRGQELRLGLAAIPGVRSYAAGGRDCLGVVSFTIDGWDVEDAGQALEESFGIICRTGLHCAPLYHAALGSAPEGTVRFSPSCFTTPEEIEQAIGAVRSLAEAKWRS